MFTSQVEKAVQVVLLGLWPPMPVELTAEYLESPAEKQHEARRKHLWSVFRWSAILSGVVLAMMIKWLWECGLLAWAGLGVGFAHASDISTVESKVAQVSAQQQEFQTLYMRDQLLTRLRDIDKEIFDLQVAIRAAERAKRNPDPLHVGRLRQLTTDRDNVVRDLQRASS